MRKDLARHGIPRDKVLGAIVRLLETTLMRGGNEEYAKSNKSDGLTTLRNRHVKLEGTSRIYFDFRGKHGTEHHIDLRDKRLGGRSSSRPTPDFCAGNGPWRLRNEGGATDRRR